MRTLIILLIAVSCHAQSYAQEKVVHVPKLAADGTPGPATQIEIRYNTANNEELLYLVNGIVVGREDVRTLSVDDIETISILKRDSLRVGCNGADRKDVVLITTKLHTVKAVLVRSATDQSPIREAVLTFSRRGIPGDTHRFLSDSLGAIDLKGLLPGVYDISVSAFGYETRFDSVQWSAGKKFVFGLKPDWKNLSEVVVKGYGRVTGCSRISCSLNSLTCGVSEVIAGESNSEKNAAAALLSRTRLFPNPVAAGGSIVQEWEQAVAAPVTLQVLSLSGQVLYTATANGKPGYQRINILTGSGWAKGIYLISLHCDGRILAREKLIVN